MLKLKLVRNNEYKFRILLHLYNAYLLCAFNKIKILYYLGKWISVSDNGHSVSIFLFLYWYVLLCSCVVLSK